MSILGAKIRIGRQKNLEKYELVGEKSKKLRIGRRNRENYELVIKKSQKLQIGRQKIRKYELGAPKNSKYKDLDGSIPLAHLCP